MTADRFPDQLNVRLPPGWRAKLEALAAGEGRTIAEFMRALIRRTLAAAERRERRHRTGR